MHKFIINQQETNMKILIPILFVTFFTCSINAQKVSGLTIEYNLFNDQIKYKRGEETILKPVVNQEENITIVIKEFNPYITKSTIEVHQINYSQTSTTLQAGDQTTQTSGDFDNLGNLLGGLSLGNNATNIYDNIPGTRGIAAQDVMQAKSKYRQMLSTLTQVENKLNKSADKINLFKTQLSSQKLASNDISKLKNNANIKPSRIKEMIEEEILHAFAKQKGETIEIDDLINEKKKKTEVIDAVKKYQKTQQEYEEVANEWINFNSVIGIINNEMHDEQLSFIQTSTDSIVNSMTQNLEHLKQNQLPAEELSNDIGNQESLSALRRTYEELQSSNFIYTFPPIQAEGDEVDIDISFSRKIETGEYESYKSLTQKIPVSGGWKIAGGIGMSFGSFAKKTYQYTVVNNIIIGDEQDSFIPVITSFAHIFKQSPKSLNIGGSFGVGLPILSSGSIQSASFFLGPTILIGKSQRLLLTAGVMGAKVERLTSGFNIGDSFDGFTEILPVNEKYDVGFFISVSFNVL